jgi:hypothetical protein
MENPALLFYAAELKRLPFKNYDILLQIIRDNGIFDLLEWHRILPTVQAFANQIIAEYGEPAAWKIIQEDICLLPYIVSCYLMLPDEYKHKFLKGESAKDLLNARSVNKPVVQNHAVPIPDEKIGPYYFTALRSTAAYQKAGRELDNCIVGLSNIRIFGIMVKNGYIGAIEVERNRVCQASLHSNAPIKENDDVYKAFMQWVKKNKLIV